MAPQIDHKKLSNDIISFRKEVLNPNKMKSGELITLDSAILIMEASFNFHHGVYNKNYCEIMYDSVIIQTEYTNNSEICMAAVEDIYIEINNSLYSIFNTCPYPNKAIKFVDIYFDANEGTNYIKTLVAIGNENLFKAGSTPISSFLETDDLWAGETPFNNQMSEKWKLANNHENVFHNNIYSGTQLFTDTEVAIALNNAITLTFADNEEYIYWVATYELNKSWAVLEYENIYEYDPDIAEPGEQDGAYANLCFLYYGYFDESSNHWIYSSNPLLKNSKDNIITSTETSYRFMNKYYNISLAAIKALKPPHKEAIDLFYGSKIEDYNRGAEKMRDLSGQVNAVYAQNYPYADSRLESLQFIW